MNKILTRMCYSIKHSLGFFNRGYSDPTRGINETCATLRISRATFYRCGEQSELSRFSVQATFCKPSISKLIAIVHIAERSCKLSHNLMEYLRSCCRVI